jgi:hypothetical protein
MCTAFVMSGPFVRYISLFAAARIREFAEAQWNILRNDVPREKGAFMAHLKGVTDR